MFLLLNYGFCFPDNKYDSYAINMRVDVTDEKEIFAPALVDFKMQSENV